MKKTENENSIVLFIFLAVFFIFIALTTIVIGSIMMARTDYLNKNGVKATARITKIEKTPVLRADGKDTEDVTVYVEFFADGEKIEGKLDTYAYYMSEGDDVEIRYMRNDPQNFTYYGKNRNLLPFLSVVIGTTFLFLSIIPLRQIVKTIKAKRFKETAKRVVTARITDIGVKQNTSINRRRKLYVSCIDADGNEYTASEYIKNANNAFKKSTIPVYLDNHGNYTIDLKEFCSRGVNDNDA